MYLFYTPVRKHAHTLISTQRHTNKITVITKSPGTTKP